MDRIEAARVLAAHMHQLREADYETLAGWIGDPQVTAVVGESGTEYQIEVEAFWDSEPGGFLRVLGSADDGTLRAAFRPVCEAFLVGPDGTVEG